MAELPVTLQRHQFVWVDPRFWRNLLDGRPDFPQLPVLDIWAESDWPLISRRAACGDQPDLLPLGLPLPPLQGKHRLSLQMPAAAVFKSARPPLLSEAAAIAPPAWRQTILSLVSVDPAVRCFGSLAWEHHTGLRYLSQTSDLDLLWDVPDADEADVLCAKLADVSARAAMRIDGELIVPTGKAVHWREWESAEPELAVKAVDGARIMPRASVFA